MAQSISYFNNEKRIIENLTKIWTMKCHSHNKFKAEHICINPACIKNLTCFLCELCVQNHNAYHKSKNLLKPLDHIFSTKLLNKVIDQQHEHVNLTKSVELQNVLKNIDETFNNTKADIINLIDDYCKNTKQNLCNNYDKLICEENNTIIKEYQNILTKHFSSDHLPELITFLEPYTEHYDRLSSLRCKQIESMNNISENLVHSRDQVKYISDVFKKEIQNLKDKFSEFTRSSFNEQKEDLSIQIPITNSEMSAMNNKEHSSMQNPAIISEIPSTKNTENFLIQIPSLESSLAPSSDFDSDCSLSKSINEDLSLIQRIENAKFVNETLPRLHEDMITQIFSYDNYKKIITYGNDNKLVIRDIQDNKIMHVMQNEENECLKEIQILKNGRIGLLFKEELKIWDPETGKINIFQTFEKENSCVKTLRASRFNLFNICFLNLENLLFLTGSSDNKLRIWNFDIVRSNPIVKPILLIHSMKQEIVSCMTELSNKEIAISSRGNIHIYKFANMNKNELNIEITLEIDRNDFSNVYGIKEIDEEKKLLIVSYNNCFRIWNYDNGEFVQMYLMKLYKDSNVIILSKEYFMIITNNIRFFNVDENELIRTMKNKTNKILGSAAQIDHNKIALIEDGEINIIEF